MEFIKTEVNVLEIAEHEAAESILELSELQLAIVGGGVGEVIVG